MSTEPWIIFLSPSAPGKAYPPEFYYDTYNPVWQNKPRTYSFKLQWTQMNPNAVDRIVAYRLGFRQVRRPGVQSASYLFILIHFVIQRKKSDEFELFWTYCGFFSHFHCAISVFPVWNVGFSCLSYSPAFFKDVGVELWGERGQLKSCQRLLFPWVLGVLIATVSSFHLKLKAEKSKQKPCRERANIAAPLLLLRWQAFTTDRGHVRFVSHQPLFLIGLSRFTNHREFKLALHASSAGSPRWGKAHVYI